MAYDYKRLQHWGRWLAQDYLGALLLGEEQRLFKELLPRHFGKHAALIGVPQQAALLSATQVPLHTVISPVLDKSSVTFIESDLHELPILTGSLDLVMLPHTLEFINNPRQLLVEACRIIKPEGVIIISGFNPYGPWGIKKWLVNSKIPPWAGDLIPARNIKNWLHLADFVLEEQCSALFRPPIQHEATYKKLHFIENLGKMCFPALSGAYILQARAKSIPLTPIKMKWKQKLGSIPISTSITGTMAR